MKTSDRALVVFWFGKQVVLNAGTEPITIQDKDDAPLAVAEAILALEPRPKAVRIIYQPADMEGSAEEVSNGTRDVIRDNLSAEHPSVSNPATAWAVNRLIKNESGKYSTLLWIDKRQRLTRLQMILREKGVDVQGAWPLVSVLEEIDPMSVAKNPAMAAVIMDGAGFAYAAGPDGSRQTVFVVNYGFRPQLLKAMGTMLRSLGRDCEPELVLVDGAVEKFELEGAELTNLPTKQVTLEDVMSVAETLPTRSHGNFLPRQMVIYADRIFRVATMAVAVAAAIAVGSYYLKYIQVKESGVEKQKAADTLRANISHLEANKAYIEEVNQLEADMDAKAYGRLRILSEIMQRRPREITVHELRITNNVFAIRGTAHEGVGTDKGPYNTFVAQLAGDEKTPMPWTIGDDALTGVLRDSNFTISGTFK